MNMALRLARLQEELTQAELAEQLGTNTISIWRWESGALPSPYYRQRICDYFHRSPADFGWPAPRSEQKSVPAPGHGTPSPDG